MKYNRLIALILTVVIFLSIAPLDAFAGLSPYLPIYGKGTYSDPADYRQIYAAKFYDNGARVPTAKFAVVNKTNGSIIGTSAADNATVTKVEGVPVGTTIKINNLSTAGSGSAIDMVDFQVTKSGSQVTAIQDTPAALGNYELTLNSTGTYNFYLCVRDNTNKTSTEGWGNWSYNGPHQATGLNFGLNGAKETTGTPETAGGDDFWGFWYYAQIQLVVTSDATALFTINHNNNNITDNKDNPLLKSSTNRTLVLQDESVQGIVDPIVTRTWYYWNVSTGWTTLAGRSGVTISGDGTTVTINDYDANLTNTDSLKKGFKLETTTKSSFKATAEHEAYMRYGSVTASYKDVDTNTSLFPDDKFSNLFEGTQPITAKAAPTGYTLLTASPQNITLDQANPDKAITFFYKKGAAVPGTGTIVVQYKDKKNPTVDVLPPDNSKTNVPYGTYTITAEPAPSGYTFDSSATPSPQTVILNSTNSFVLVTFYYIPAGGGGSGDQPPIAVITGPSERMAGENVNFSGASSKAFNGKTIVELIWDVPSARINSKIGKNINVWYPEAGDYDVFLTVVDSAGLTADCMTSIKITPPIPTSVIDVSGIYKENRKVSVTGENSYSPPHYPINIYSWTLTNGADARYIGSFGSDVSKDLIFKKAQAYRFDLRVTNTYGLSNSTNRSITIVPDVAPTADFSVAAQVLRDPKNSNTATITATNLSKSTDGDTIKKTVMFYAYDSNNDGNFDNETWYYSKDGITWTATGLTYSQLDSFDLYNLSGASNPANFTVKTNQVGKYKFECKTIEDIPAADTIPSLLTAADYKTGITLTSKPNSAKIVEVINTAPQVSFEVRKKKPVDILVFTDYANTKLDNLQAAINVKKAQLNAINIDPNFVIVNTSKAIGNQALKKYRYFRDLHFIMQINSGSATDMWMPSGFPYYKDEGTLWEETISYEKPLNEIPFGRTYSRYQYINTTTRSGFVEAITRNYKVYDTVGGYEDVSFNTYYNQSGPYYEWTSYSVNSVYADPEWKQDTYIGTDNLAVTSIDLDAIKTMPLRAGSDRYAIFISDGKGKDYSISYGSNFSFGSLTNDLKNYINTNNFKIYTIADPRTMNTLIDKEIGVDLQACDTFESLNNYSIAMYQTANGYYYFYHTKTNKPYIVDSSSFGEVKSLVSPGFILMKNGTTKYFNGTSFINVPVNNVASVQKLDGYRYFALITSTGVSIVDGSDNWKVKTTVPATDIVSLTYGYNDTYDYCVVASKDGVKFLNLSTMTIANTLALNNFLSINIVGYDSIILADSNSIYIIKASNMSLYRSFAISGGVKQVYPKSGLVSMTDGTNYYDGIYVVSSTGRIYGYKDTNYDNLIETTATLPAAFSSYTIKSILDFSDSYTFSYSFYLQTTDNKLLFFDSYANSLTVKNSSFNVVEVATRANKTGLLIRLSDGSVFTSYPIVTGGHWAGPSGDKYWVDEYTQSDFFNVPLPAGVTAKQLFITSFSGMLLLGDDNNLYQVTHASGQYTDRTPYVVLYKSGVSSIIKEIEPGWSVGAAIFFRLTDGNIYHKYYDASNRYLYEKTYTNLKKFALTDDSKTYFLYNDGTSNNNIITTNITMTNPSAGYITLNDLINSNYDSMTYGAGQYTQALDHLVSRYTADPSYSTNYILLGDTVNYNVIYQDTENDPKYKEYWTYDHNQNYFDTPLGTLSVSGQTINYPVTAFDKTGKYVIDLKIRDNPKDDDRFDNYRLPNQGIVNATLYVHRKPIPVIRPVVTPNGSYYRVQAVDGGSYDLDHVSRSDKGIAAREWRWKEALDTSWHNGQIDKPDCSTTETYYIQLRVKDLEGVWSDWTTVAVDVSIMIDYQPIAKYSIFRGPTTVPSGEKVSLVLPTDTSKGVSITSSKPIASAEYLIDFGTGYTKVANLTQSDYSSDGTNYFYQYQIADLTLPANLGDGIYSVRVQAYTSSGETKTEDRNIFVYTPVWQDYYTYSSLQAIDNPLGNIPSELETASSTAFEEKATFDILCSDYTNKLKIELKNGTNTLSFYAYKNGTLDLNGTGIGATSSIQSTTGTMLYRINNLQVLSNKPGGAATAGGYNYRFVFDISLVDGYPFNSGEQCSVTVTAFDNAGSSAGKYGNPQTTLINITGLKLFDFKVTDVRDVDFKSMFNGSGLTFAAPNLALDASDHPKKALMKKGYAFYFELSSKGLNAANDTIRIRPTFYTADTRTALDMYYATKTNEYVLATSNYGSRSADDTIRVFYEKELTNLLGYHNELFLPTTLRSFTGNTQLWKGRYGIPATAIFVPKGQDPSIESNRIKKPVIIHFDLEAIKGGAAKYNYVGKGQWEKERVLLSGYPINPAKYNMYPAGDIIVIDPAHDVTDDYEAVPTNRN